MAKFKMKMKLTGFELEIEGERADVPLMAQNIGQQFAAMLEPATNIVEGEEPRKMVTNSVLPASQIEPQPPRARGRRGGNGGPRIAATVVTISHDATKWGNPWQGWNPTKKAIWLLHVLEAATGTKELSAPEIAATFNNQYKQFGKIQASNVARDLAKSKSGATALFVEDTASGPVAKWSLGAKGKAEAESLVQFAKTPEPVGVA